MQLAPPERRGRGGRNQQLVLAALCHLLAMSTDSPFDPAGRVILSGGTDGEDGPTDAAGALIDDQRRPADATLGLNPREFLHRNDAYPFFVKTDGLIRTGPTHTNVCDVRVALARA